MSKGLAVGTVPHLDDGDRAVVDVREHDLPLAALDEVGGRHVAGYWTVRVRTVECAMAPLVAVTVIE